MVITYSPVEEKYIILFSDQLRTPILLINSEDDIVCLAENIRDDIVRYVSR